MTVTENDRFPKIKKRFQRQLLQSDAKTENTYTSTHQLLTNYFSTFYGKKLAFSSGFLYLCTGNRKNSLLVPRVGHLWRPRLVLIDGRRWSSMKTTKWAGNGFLRNCDSRNSQTQTEHDQLQERLQHYKQVGRVIPPPLPCSSRTPSPWLYQDRR